MLQLVLFWVGMPLLIAATYGLSLLKAEHDFNEIRRRRLLAIREKHREIRLARAHAATDGEEQDEEKSLCPCC